MLKYILIFFFPFDGYSQSNNFVFFENNLDYPFKDARIEERLYNLTLAVER
jgi:hypothetical protein